jgi:hypothetical protein
MMINLELREQVAIARGWTDIKPLGKYLVPWGIDPDDQYQCRSPIPEYDLSIDAIASEFDKKQIPWGVETIHQDDENDEAIPKLIGYGASSSDFDIEIQEETAAIALCKLFLAICAKEKDNG